MLTRIYKTIFVLFTVMAVPLSASAELGQVHDASQVPAWSTSTHLHAATLAGESISSESEPSETDSEDAQDALVGLQARACEGFAARSLEKASLHAFANRFVGIDSRDPWSARGPPCASK